MAHDELEGWPGEEATEPEGATFVVSNPWILLSGQNATGVGHVFQDAEEPATHAEQSHEASAVFTSARTVVLEATCASAIYDPSLFEDATEPARAAESMTAPDGPAQGD